MDVIDPDSRADSEGLPLLMGVTASSQPGEDPEISQDNPSPLSSSSASLPFEVEWSWLKVCSGE